MKKNSWLFILYCSIVIVGIALFLIFYKPFKFLNRDQTGTEQTEVNNEEGNPSIEGGNENPQQEQPEKPTEEEETSVSYSINFIMSRYGENVLNNPTNIEFDYDLDNSTLTIQYEIKDKNSELAQNQAVSVNINNTNVIELKNNVSPLISLKVKSKGSVTLTLTWLGDTKVMKEITITIK